MNQHFAHEPASQMKPAAETQAQQPQPAYQGATYDPPTWMVIACLILLGIGLFVFRVGNRGLWSAQEGRAAQNAHTMIQYHDWMVPRLFSDDPDHQKPPMYYWLVALVSAANDKQVTARTVRLPSSIAAIVGLIVVFQFGKRIWNTETGIWAAVILACTTRYAWLARVGRIDMPLCVASLVALFLFCHCAGVFRDNSSLRRRLSWWFYVVVAVGILLKGPVALVLIVAPIVVFLLVTGEPIIPGWQNGWRETWLRYRIAFGACLTLAIAAPWFIYMTWISAGSFFWDFFYYHNVERALGTSEALKAGPFWFYIPRILVDAFPWSILFPALALTFWKERRRIRVGGDGTSRAYLFLLVWLGSQFLFLSLVSFKRADYLLPVLPAVALLLAGWLNDRVCRFETRLATQRAKNPQRRARLVQMTAIALASLTFPLLIWATIEFLKKGVVNSLLKIDLIAKYLNLTDRFMMRHVERLLRENWPLLAIGLVVVVGCVWLFHVGWHNRRNRRIVAGLALPWAVCFLFQLHVLLPALDPLREMSRFAEVIRTLATGDRPIYYFGKFDADLVFHAGRPARLIGNSEQLVALNERSEPSFVVMKASLFESLKNEPSMRGWKPIADNRRTAFGEHRHARVLLTNRPSIIANRPVRSAEPRSESF